MSTPVQVDDETMEDDDEGKADEIDDQTTDVGETDTLTEPEPESEELVESEEPEPTPELEEPEPEEPEEPEELEELEESTESVEREEPELDEPEEPDIDTEASALGADVNRLYTLNQQNNSMSKRDALDAAKKAVESRTALLSRSFKEPGAVTDEEMNVASEDEEMGVAPENEETSVASENEDGDALYAKLDSLQQQVHTANERTRMAHRRSVQDANNAKLALAQHAQKTSEMLQAHTAEWREIGNDIKKKDVPGAITKIQKDLSKLRDELVAAKQETGSDSEDRISEIEHQIGDRSSKLQTLESLAELDDTHQKKQRENEEEATAIATRADQNAEDDPEVRKSRNEAAVFQHQLGEQREKLKRTIPSAKGTNQKPLGYSSTQASAKLPAPLKPHTTVRVGEVSESEDDESEPLIKPTTTKRRKFIAYGGETAHTMQKKKLTASLAPRKKKADMNLFDRFLVYASPTYDDTFNGFLKLTMIMLIFHCVSTIGLFVFCLVEADSLYWQLNVFSFHDLQSAWAAQLGWIAVAVSCVGVVYQGFVFGMRRRMHNPGALGDSALSPGEKSFRELDKDAENYWWFAGILFGMFDASVLVFVGGNQLFFVMTIVFLDVISWYIMKQADSRYDLMDDRVAVENLSMAVMIKLWIFATVIAVYVVSSSGTLETAWANDNINAIFWIYVFWNPIVVISLSLFRRSPIFPLVRDVIMLITALTSAWVIVLSSATERAIPGGICAAIPVHGC